ncbi:centriolar satellite-associated tubulin polyglutamylase complex regulator 1 isoform X6 [Rattus norvegicus]|uniref:centriolar satellite-associated tubulin polyglutamylase complex regulator 1 isoform X6 n=1 Tax=Rattus norvegicus TaxID=10116 RepID=UPI002FD86BCC
MVPWQQRQAVTWVPEEESWSVETTRSKDAESRAPSSTGLRVSGFNSVCQGTHILFREFSFIQATPHNRASFLRAFWRCFRTVGKNGDLLTMREYHCLLQLLCPDFPLELTQKAASCPPPALVKEILSNVQRLTFYGFLVALSKHHGINQALGALPDKGDLMHDPAMDEELERLLVQVPGLVNSITATSEASCLPSRTPPRVGSPWKPLHRSRKLDAESDGSTEETDESET